MSTIANLDVNFRVNVGAVFPATQLLAARFGWLGFVIDGVGQKIAHEYDSIFETYRRAQKLGTSTEFLGALEWKSKLNPAELDVMLRRFEQRIGMVSGKIAAAPATVAAQEFRHLAGHTVKTGVHVDQLSATFQRLGINVQKLRAMPLEEQWMRVADAMDSVTNASDRMSLEFALAGRTGANAYFAMTGGSKAIRQAMKEATDAGYAVSMSEAVEVYRAKMAMKDIEQSMKGFRRTVAIASAPLVRMGADWLRGLMGAISASKPELLKWGRWLEYLVINSFKNAFEATKLWWFDLMLAIRRSFERFLSDIRGIGMGMGINLLGPTLVAFKTENDRWERILKNRHEDLEAGWRGFLDDKAGRAKPQPDNELPFTAKADNAAALRGSAEAFKIINNRNSDKMYKVASDQLAELRKILSELKRGKRGLDVRRARV